MRLSFTFSYLYLLFTFLLSGGSILAQETLSFKSIITSANEKFTEKDYISAKTYYEMALRIKEDDAFSKQRLSETIELIQKQLETQGVFYRYLDQGDQLNREGKLEDALFFYNKALEIFPADKYTLAQADKINKTLEEAANRKQNYNQSMELGDQLLLSQKYEEALVQFNQASTIFADESLPKEKIESTKKLLELQKQKEVSFQQFITEANNQISRKNYQDAIKNLLEALAIIPDDAKTTALLEETRQLLDKSNLYKEALAKADDAYEKKLFEQSITLYQNALEIWPNQPYPADMILRINQSLNSEKYLKEVALKEYLAQANTFYANQQFEDALQAYNKVLEIDPEHKQAGDRLTEISFIISQNKAKQQNEILFAQFITTGDSAMSAGKYEEALADYQEALNIKPDNSDVKIKINNVESLLNKAQALLEKAAAYERIITEADMLLSQNELNNARQRYESAIQIDNTQTYPVDQIKKVDLMLVDQAEKNKANLKYNELIASALKHFEARNLNEARSEYVKASEFKPEDETPHQQIIIIDRMLADEVLSRAKDEQYNNLLDMASSAFDVNNFELAIGKYEEASLLKPEESLPKEKIEQIKLLLNEKLTLAQKEKEFSELILLADSQFENKNYEASLENYRIALGIFIDRQHPSDRIQQIDQIFKEIAAAQALDENYNKLISNADDLFASAEYPKAQTIYNEAIVLKPDEIYPKNQLDKINVIMSDMVKEVELLGVYNEHIAQADQLFNTKSYDQSKERYEKALQLRPEENYPKEQLLLIDESLKLIAEAKAIESRIDKLRAEGDNYFGNKKYTDANAAFDQILLLDPDNSHAQAKKAEIALALASLARENQQRYDEAIADAEKNVGLKEYKLAVVSYKTALGYKPDDTFANTRISQVEAIIQEELLVLKTEYNKFITAADKSYNIKNYDNAIESYLKAENIKPDERYPREMIHKIAQIIEENKIRELNSAATLIASNVSKRFTFEPVDVIERRANYILIKAKNTGNSAFPLIVNFGSASSRNGGFVLPIPASEEYNDFVVRIGSQYKWFSEDNTWIELLPENGEVEVSIIQISKGN